MAPRTSTCMGPYRQLTWILTLLSGLCTLPTLTDGNDAETCGWEDFEASCDPGYMLLMRNASYGRMRLGRCVKTDYGHLGCGSNVLQAMHTLCSGRETCYFPVSSKLHLHEDHDCPTDLNAYLVAQYSCVPVVSCDASKCQQSDFLRVASSSGYLSSEITWQTRCGSTTCPWMIEAAEGQRINFTLLDFTGTRAPTLGKVCWKYATMQDEGSVSKDITVCTGDQHGTTQSFLSETNKVSIVLHTPNDVNDLMYFAMKYDVVGCPALNAPVNSEVERDGNRATISCTRVRKTWELTCDGRAWVGKVGSCDEEEQGGAGFLDDRSQTLGKTGMLLIIGLGVVIGIIVGGLLLAIALCALRRRNRHREALRTETRLLEESEYYAEQNRYTRDSHKNSIPMSVKQCKVIIPPRGEHDYTCTLPHRMGHVPPMACDPHARFDPRAEKLRMDARDEGFPPPPDFVIKEHIYETPRFPLQDMPRKGVATRSADGICRKLESDEGKSNRTS